MAFVTPTFCGATSTDSAKCCAVRAPVREPFTHSLLFLRVTPVGAFALRTPASRWRSQARAHAVRPDVAGISACASATGVGLEGAWTTFAERMKETNESPAVEEWNELFETARAASDSVVQALWVLDRMQETGRRANASTYEILLEICLAQENRAAVFLLVEKMWADKVLLGDVSLPEDMEKTLRAILPPEAFD